jgi:hypothetical protein
MLQAKIRALASIAALSVLIFTAACSTGAGPAAANSSGGGAITVSVAPGTVSLTTAATQQFTAGVSGTSDQAVTWTATGGTITSGGLFTAGKTTGSFKVTATSVADTSKAAQAGVTIKSPPGSVSVSISPGTASLTTGATQQFSASVSGASDTAVTWAATGGSITSSGLFTAGKTTGSFKVTATSVADTSKAAQAGVTIKSPPTSVSVSISPGTASLTTGATQQFSASVSGASDTAVTWTATGGSINSSGVYSAGSSAGTYVVTATSVADAAKSASATVKVSSPTASAKRLFTSSAANWLYSAPTGSGISIASVTASLQTHIYICCSWNYPVQYTDATHGYTTFSDTAYYGRTDVISVPNPANGYWPTTGSDGHLLIVDTTHKTYYDFWALQANNGVPVSTSVGEIKSGSLATSNGTPGTTATQITGLAGDILPGELDCETCLNHALSVVVPGAMNSPIWGKQAPIMGSDGSVSGGIFREGAKIRFDPSIDVSSMSASTAVKALARALQLYGGLIVDQTGCSNCINIYSDLTTAPDETGMDQISQHLLIYY